MLQIQLRTEKGSGKRSVTYLPKGNIRDCKRNEIPSYLWIIRHIARDEISFQLIAVCIIHSIIHIILGIPIRSNLFTTYPTRFNFNFSILVRGARVRPFRVVDNNSDFRQLPARNSIWWEIDSIICSMRSGKKSRRRRGEEERISTKFYPRRALFARRSTGFRQSGRKKSILINIEMGNVQRDGETIENCTWKIWEINLKWKRRGIKIKKVNK